MEYLQIVNYILPLLMVTSIWPDPTICVPPVAIIAPIAGSVTIGNFIHGLFRTQLQGKDRNFEEEKLHFSYIEQQLATVQKFLKKLPRKQSVLDKKTRLHYLFYEIDKIFAKAMFMKNNILNRRIEHESRYTDFKNFYEPEIDKVMMEIRYLLSNDNKQFNFLKNYNSKLEVNTLYD